MQAAGGGLDIKFMRVARSDAIIVGEGTLTVNAHGKLDGLIHVAIVGIERIVPLLGVDRLIGRSIDRLAGSDNASQGLGALDRLVPGLGGALRDTRECEPDRQSQEDGPADRGRQISRR